MALVKFSVTIATVSQAVSWPTTACHENARLADGLQDAADPQARRQRTGAGDEAAGKAAEQRRGKADALDDHGVFVRREAEIEHEGFDHDAGEARR